MSKQAAASKKVAYLVPMIEGVYFEMVEYMQRELQREIPDLIQQVFPIGGPDPIVIRPMVRDLIIHEFNLVFVVSPEVAGVVKSEIESSGSELQLLFSGVPYPVEFGLVDSLDSPGGCISGTIHTIQDVQSFADFFLDCFPHIRNVSLLSYVTSTDRFSLKFLPESKNLPSLDDLHTEVKKLFELSHMNVHLLQSSNVEHLMKKALSISERGAIITFEGSRSNALNGQLFNYLRAKKGILYTGLIKSVFAKEAHIGYGIDFQRMSISLTNQAKVILIDGIRAGKIPVSVFSDCRKAVINKSAIDELPYEINVEPIVSKWNATLVE